MYLGNSRMLLGKNTNEKVIGDWLAVAPSNASSGTYGINNGQGGYCSEIFNGYLYVGGQFTQLINNTTTSTANNLIKYNLGDTSAIWQNSFSTSLYGVPYSLRDIGSGDHLLIATTSGLRWLGDTSDITAAIIGSSTQAFTGLSNVFTSITLNTTTYSTTSNYMCIATELFGEDGYILYDGVTKSIVNIIENALNLGGNGSWDTYISSSTNGTALTLGETFFSSGPYNPAYTDLSSDDNIPPTNIPSEGKYHQKMINIPIYPNKIWIALGGDFGGDRIYAFNYSSNSFDEPTIIGKNIDPITLNTVVYKETNYLIIGGEKGIYLIDPTNPNTNKDLGMPVNQPTINSISVGSDSTIYVTGSFSFVDKNGVTAKNIAKFVPDASKLP